MTQRCMQASETDARLASQYLPQDARTLYRHPEDHPGAHTHTQAAVPGPYQHGQLGHTQSAHQQQNNPLGPAHGAGRSEPPLHALPEQARAQPEHARDDPNSPGHHRVAPVPFNIPSPVPPAATPSHQLHTPPEYTASGHLHSHNPIPLSVAPSHPLQIPQAYQGPEQPGSHYIDQRIPAQAVPNPFSVNAPRYDMPAPASHMHQSLKHPSLTHPGYSMPQSPRSSSLHPSLISPEYRVPEYPYAAPPYPASQYAIEDPHYLYARHAPPPQTHMYHHHQPPHVYQAPPPPMQHDPFRDGYEQQHPHYAHDPQQQHVTDQHAHYHAPSSAQHAHHYERVGDQHAEQYGRVGEQRAPSSGSGHTGGEAGETEGPTPKRKRKGEQC